MRIKLLLAFALLLGGALSVWAEKPVLRFNKSGKFKIVQFTDVHYRPDGKPECVKALETIRSLVDTEKPDLVVFTGDIVTGRPVKKAWSELMATCVERSIPYAVVFGNHDDESGTNREGLCEIVSSSPLSLMPDNIYADGQTGGYVVSVLASGSEKPAFSLFMLDSNAYSTIKSIDGYGWFTNDQVQWFRQTSAEIRRNNNRKVLPALAFFHIPLPEYTQAFNNESPKPVGVREEDECAPKVNSGMFVAMLESQNVAATFVGHDHVNDYVGVFNGLALCYGRSTAGKTTYGWEQGGCRVIEIYEGKKKFDTYTRTPQSEPQNLVRYPPILTLKN